MPDLSARNSRGISGRGQGGPNEVVPTLDLATIREVGSADNGEDVSESRTIGSPNSAVVASRGTSRPVDYSDKSPCRVVLDIVVEGGDKPSRAPDNEIHVLHPDTGNCLPDQHVPARIQAAIPRPITRGREGTYSQDITQP